MTEDEIQARAKKLVLEYIREGISDRFADVALIDIYDDEDYEAVLDAADLLMAEVTVP